MNRQEIQNLLDEMERQRNEEIALLRELQASIGSLKQEIPDSPKNHIPNMITTNVNNLNAECCRQRDNLRFEDIAASFKKFRGDRHINIRSWLKHFGEQCEVFHLSPLEKFVYAKRLMEGTAQYFIEFESVATNFEQLEVELIGEFGESINSALIHQKLQERKKRDDETPTQYLYEMLSIASQSNMG